MASFSSCWLMVELIIIPDGFIKWFYLSFYVHPVFLVFCQMFLWARELYKGLLAVLCLLYRIACVAISFILGPLGWVVLVFSKFTRSDNQVVDEVELSEIDQDKAILPCDQTNAYEISRTVPKIVFFCTTDDSTLEVDDIFETMDSDSEDSQSCVSPSYDQDTAASISPASSFVSLSAAEMEDTENVLCCGSNIMPTPDVDTIFPFPPSSDLCLPAIDDHPIDDLPSMLEHELPSYICSLEYSPLLDQEMILSAGVTAEVDPHYHTYTERMRWFDVLSEDRLHALDSLGNNQKFEIILASLGDRTWEASSSWRKIATKRMVKSLESDIELVYVAQTCLSWEALHYQYCKVEALARSCPAGIFRDNVTGRFQKLQILLERYLEDEELSGSRRHSNYVQKRFSSKSLLQVPEISEYYQEGDNGRTEGWATSAADALKSIENCIRVFWSYVKADSSRKRPWKSSRLLWKRPPVEDPRDLELLVEITRSLKKTEQCLEGLKGKKNGWAEGTVNPLLGEAQQKDILFTMMDMKLVGRVLKMSIISTSQLKWCQEKLNNIEFRDGRVHRASTTHLFPSS